MTATPRPLEGARILFASLREPSYVRNQALVRAMRAGGAEVTVISSSAKGYPMRTVQTLGRLLFGVRRLRKHDLLFAGFLGQPVAIAMRLLSSRPIAFDHFISVHDTVCLDRKKVRPDGWLGRRLLGLDRRAHAAATVVLTDTAAHAGHLQRLVGIDRPFHAVPVGTDEDTFRPLEGVAESPRTVFYYSSSLPLHGVDVVLDAARLLEAEGVRFRIAGDRPGAASPANVEWLGWQPLAALADEGRRATLCLAGHFAVNAKGQRVVPGKAFQFLSLGRPIVLGRGSGNEEWFRDGDNAYLCEPGAPDDLARVIREALRDSAKRHAVARRGRATFLAVAGKAVLAERVGAILAPHLRPRAR